MAITDAINCACSDTTGHRSLVQLRQALMVRLGFGAQADNPPPGMAALLNSFLQEAQRLLAQRTAFRRLERYFSWPLTEGVALYDFPDNAEQTSDPPCTKTLDPNKVTWVGIERDGQWYELAAGIAPELYSSDQQGRPERYAFRQCIELWPAPDETSGNLVIRGDFGLEPFTADAHTTTIPDDLVFLLALANAKAHYRQPDANNYVTQLETLLDNYVAGTHATRRYVPGRNGRGDGVYTYPTPTVPFA